MEKRSWFYQNGLFYTILALVLLLHLILLLIRFYQKYNYAELPKKEVPLKVRILTPEQESKLKRQIVESENPENTEKPKEGYLSDRNRTFDRESVARKIDRFNEGGKGADSNADKGEVGKKSGGQKKLSLSDLGAFSKDHNPLKEAAKEMQKTAKAGNPESRKEKRGISSTNDFVEEVPLGDLTYLNTVEYKHYGFYYRIKQKLEQFWGRSIHEKAETLMKDGRKIATDEENLITSVEVTLNEVGEIIGITIKGTSGVKELDDAAVESFNDAGPFPNPPKELVHNGQVTIEWGFVVNI